MFLADVYHIFLHVCPIMQSSVNRCQEQFTDLCLYLTHKIAEETGRERAILEDLAVFSFDEHRVITAFPSAPVRAMLAYNYYACEHIHPVCAVGMLYMLEWISSVYAGQLASAIALGLQMSQEAGFTFLYSHAAMELDHVAELRALLQTMNDSAMQKIIIDAIQMNFYLFITFMRSEQHIF
jgi:hypothetical protein